MTKHVAPDLTTDSCPNCGGTFLDKGELNSLATGMGGDIELCCLDGPEPDDSKSARRCPRCPDTSMQKVSLLSCLDLALDFCPECHGFFLEKGETAAMNGELRRIAHSQPGMEYRGEIDGRLVRVDNVNGSTIVPTELCLANKAVPTVSVIVTVFLKTPLGLGLRISSEKWTDRLRKLARLFHGQDITVGDHALDAAYLIQGAVEAKIKALLSHADTKQALVEFDRSKPKIMGLPGKLTVFDDRLEYAEGPYGGDATQVQYDAEKDPAGVVKRLLSLAALLERV